MNAELLSELVDYRTSKQKSVMMASRSILQLYRVINPELLPRKERVRLVCSFIFPVFFDWILTFRIIIIRVGPQKR